MRVKNFSVSAGRAFGVVIYDHAENPMIYNNELTELIIKKTVLHLPCILINKQKLPFSSTFLEIFKRGSL